MRKENSWAIFDFEQCDENLIECLSDYIDQKAQFAFDFFEIDKPLNKVLIKIIPTKKSFDEYYIKTYNLSPNSEIKSWLIGSFSYEREEIFYLSLHDFKSATHEIKDFPFNEALEYYKKTIFHEFIHYVNGLFRKKYDCDYSAKYLTEGIATYLSEQYNSSALKFDFTIDDVLDENKNIYYAYFLLTKFLVENYDKNFVLEMFKSRNNAVKFLEKELFNRAKTKFLGDNY